MSTRLFSEFERTDGSLSGNAESSYQFLNRVERPAREVVRDTLDIWFKAPSLFESVSL